MEERRYGDIPGFAAGHLFENRAALARAGVHRPLMRGICGGASAPAESIVISGGYEDDEDSGDEIIYTGEVGNDPATSRQRADQSLLRGNAALALNSLEGVPVRVVRGARHGGVHAPPTGYVYSGLYRVDDYWRERGKSGFVVWRFRLRRVNANGAFMVREPKAEYETTKRLPATIVRVVRTTALANRVKQLHDHTCQICGTRLLTPAGLYAEAAHIRALGRPHHGPDHLRNILYLCPNCHLLFDTGAIVLDDDLIVHGIASLAGRPLRTRPEHPIDLEFIRYHRSRSAGGISEQSSLAVEFAVE